MTYSKSFPETTRTLAAALRELAEQWKIDGCKAFDEGDTPSDVAEAAGVLRCAVELSDLLATFDRAERGVGAAKASDSHVSAPTGLEDRRGTRFQSHTGHGRKLLR